MKKTILAAAIAISSSSAAETINNDPIFAVGFDCVDIARVETCVDNARASRDCRDFFDSGIDGDAVAVYPVDGIRPDFGNLPQLGDYSVNVGEVELDCQIGRFRSILCLLPDQFSGSSRFTATVAVNVQQSDIADDPFCELGLTHEIR